MRRLLALSLMRKHCTTHWQMYASLRRRTSLDLERVGGEVARHVHFELTQLFDDFLL
jgi:hypothetical protein